MCWIELADSAQDPPDLPACFGQASQKRPAAAPPSLFEAVEQTQGEGVVPLELGLYAELAGNRAAHHTVRVLAEDPLQPVLPERACDCSSPVSRSASAGSSCFEPPSSELPHIGQIRAPALRGRVRLLRRQLPAVPRQEPARLPLPRQHRGEVPAGRLTPAGASDVASFRDRPRRTRHLFHAGAALCG